MECTKRPIWVAIVTSSLLLLPSAGQTAEVPSVGIVTSLAASTVHVTVHRPLPLDAVLNELCRAADATCEGTELGAASTVAPLSVSGSWSEVVEKLIDGSGLNYVSILPAEGRRGTLLISRSSDSASATSLVSEPCPSNMRRRRREAVIANPQPSDGTCSNLNHGISATALEQVPDAASPASPDSPAALNEDSQPASAGQDDPNRGQPSHSRSPFPEAGVVQSSSSGAQASGSPFPESLVSQH